MLSTAARRASAQPALRRSLSAAAASRYGDVPMGPADPILGLNEMFQNDASPDKMTWGVGAYRDNENQPYVLESVREAERRNLEENLNKEYAGIAGLPGFVRESLKFAYGKSVDASKIAGVQTLSGTGACRLAGDFIKRFRLSTDDAMYHPTPTWGNHIPIHKDSGLDVRQYRYYSPETIGLDFDGLMADLSAAPNGSAFLLHACAHNPTGVDPSKDQWSAISDLMLEKRHLPFFDCAYQGFASGDADKDAWAIRHFAEQGHTLMLAQSFAKNFGLYGERVGAFSVVCADEEEKARVESQLKILIRPMYSNPPINGARIVETILTDPVLEKQWYGECKAMADRIISMRTALKDALAAQGSTKNWDHVTSQIGMFAFTGLAEDQVTEMREKFHIYMTKDGRISMAGVTTHNVDYLAKAMHEVTAR